MKDPRIEQLANNLIQYSVKLQRGEKILIEVDGLEIPLAKELVRQAYLVGGVPFLLINNHEILREILSGCTEEQLKAMASYDLNRVNDMQAYILIRAGENMSELSGVSPEKMALYRKYYSQPINGRRYNNTKWCILRYPNHAMAQQANMSTEDFEDLYFNVCNLDYSKMDRAMDNLIELMEQTDKVKIIGEGTELTFSIKGMPCIKDSGIMNLPDGEVYTMPVKDSVNGVISYNTPSLKEGFTYENIRFEIKDGKIIHATGNDSERINKLLNTDQGSRYFGEFGIGLNPYIESVMKDTLFDEKIWGSFHFTPGCVPVSSPGNENWSELHWDIVNIQRPEYGGGEIWFDDILIRKDGMFIPDILKGLNPENLK
ncbi:aminopeptidase [Paenibacillus sp. p3-SID867]|uniref:aminopeptidase n=1 Tax=Paenibacillus sp. p3-SID867 TaxID=2916363 RepID=UPI0021A8B0FB|nr:aminopeptidase [Paenibacillus sp. p3-SID867]MCT1404025.1 aminopeptidase [Paenibacillus sp. p3-SID867]